MIADEIEVPTMICVYDVRLKSRSPYLMHRFPVENGSEGNSPTIPQDLTPAQAAERAAYRTVDGELYIPAEHLEGAIRDGARFHKIGRRAAWPLAGAAVLILTRQIRLGVERYAVDSRPVVIPSTKGRIMRHRPMIADWEIDFQLELDTSIFSDGLFRKILTDAGLRAGIGDYRPARSGPFGRFNVLRLEAAAK
jgi:hypothetical protein